VFGNRVLRRIFESKYDEVMGGRSDNIMENSVICTSHQILFG